MTVGETFGSDRNCKLCHKPLSMYNPNKYCFAHNEASRRKKDNEEIAKEKANNKKMALKHKLNKMGIKGKPGRPKSEPIQKKDSDYRNDNSEEREEG